MLLGPSFAAIVVIKIIGMKTERDGEGALERGVRLDAGVGCHRHSLGLSLIHHARGLYNAAECESQRGIPRSHQTEENENTNSVSIRRWQEYKAPGSVICAGGSGMGEQGVWPGRPGGVAALEPGVPSLEKHLNGAPARVCKHSSRQKG